MTRIRFISDLGRVKKSRKMVSAGLVGVSSILYIANLGNFVFRNQTLFVRQVCEGTVKVKR